MKCGTTEQGKQRYACRATDCPTKTFILEYSYAGCLPEVKEKVIDMALNGSGIRDAARVLKISPTTVMRELKKEANLGPVNRAVLKRLNSIGVQVEIQRVEAAEVDEMWSYVGSKKNPRWLWHGIDHHTGTLLAYVFGHRQMRFS